MSAQEIMAELPKLSRQDLERLNARVGELLNAKTQTSNRPWTKALLTIAGTAADLPSDFAHNHDHYLHGTPKQ